MFVPDGFEPPLGLVCDVFRLEPLGPEHNERDFAAWSSSIEHIRSSPGFGPDASWPRPMSLEENHADLERHARDFADGTGFTYSVLDDAGDVIGCVYVYPARDDAHDVHARSWVTRSRADLDLVLRRSVADWLESAAWPFERPLYEPCRASRSAGPARALRAALRRGRPRRRSPR